MKINLHFLLSFLSTVGSRKVGGNPAGLPAKAKYNLVTDSEPVPWGKGEKQSDKDGEIEPETIMPTRSQSYFLNSDGVRFAERANEFFLSIV